MSRRRSLRGIRLWAALCLVLGVVINVGVAWGLASSSSAGARMLASTGGFSMTLGSGGSSSMSYGRVSVNIDAAGWDMCATDTRTGGGGYEHTIEWTAGWPLRSLRAVDRGASERPVLGMNLKVASPHGLVRGIALSGSRRLPLLPVWPGFLVNSLAFAAAPLAVLGLVVWRRSRRFPEGCCAACGYPVGVSPVCTECGALLRPGAAGDSGGCAPEGSA